MVAKVSGTLFSFLRRWTRHGKSGSVYGRYYWVGPAAIRVDGFVDWERWSLSAGKLSVSWRMSERRHERLERVEDAYWREFGMSEVEA